MDEENEAVVEETPASVGARLRGAREAAGLSVEDIAARTKIAERHLMAIEDDRFSDLAARTYAVGFSRSYARTVDLDEEEIADAVKAQLAMDEEAYPRGHIETFEPGDPARVPSSQLAWVAAIVGIVAVLVLLYLFWPSFLSPQGSLPDLVQEKSEAPVAAAPPQLPRQQEQAAGPVVFTATAPRVWVKFYDAAGNQLFQEEMGEGESYTVPADAKGPLLWTARPDALAITVGGKELPRLSNKPETMKDVPVSAKALLKSAESNKPAETNDTAAAVPSSSEPASRSTPVAAQSEPRRAPAPPPRAAPQPAAYTPVATGGAAGAVASNAQPAGAVKTSAAKPAAGVEQKTATGEARTPASPSTTVSTDSATASTDSDPVGLDSANTD